MNKGLTGWLSAEGEFFPCGYGQHYELAIDIINEQIRKDVVEKTRKEHYEKTNEIVQSERQLLELMTWIPMGIPKSGSHPTKDYLYISYDVGITAKQKEWFQKNQNKLSLTQIKLLQEALEDLS